MPLGGASQTTEEMIAKMPEYVDQAFRFDPLDTHDLLAAARKNIVDMRAGLLGINDGGQGVVPSGHRQISAVPSSHTQIQTQTKLMDDRAAISPLRSSFLQAADTYSGSVQFVSMQGSISTGAESGQSITCGAGDVELRVMKLAWAAELPVGAELLDVPLTYPPHAIWRTCGSTSGHAERGRRKLIADDVISKLFL